MAPKSDPSKFQYKYTGDTMKLFRGKLIRPGDPIESDEELIMGEFEPQNAIAKSAKDATDIKNDQAAKVAADERLAAMNASLPVEVLADQAAAAASPVSTSVSPAQPSTASSAAPSAPSEA